MKIKYKIAIILFFIYLYSPPVNAQDNGTIKFKDTDNYIILELEKTLIDMGWRTSIDKENKNTLTAFKYEKYYSSLTVSIETGTRPLFHIITVSISKNSKQSSRVFTIKNDAAADDTSIKTLITPYLLEHSLPDEKSLPEDKIYSSGISIGYNRTHDNRKFYPEWGQGSFYNSLFLYFDPAKNVKSEDMPLHTGDYLSFDFYFAYDSHVRENFFNIDVIIYGRNRYSEKNGNGNEDKISNRTVYGFFNGFEYFRPGYYNNALAWNRKIYKKQPHIQYTIWRALQWGFINTYKNGAVYKSSFMIGFGPSINSSLTATHVTEEEEKELSYIFKSIKYRKQNYYYSVALPITAGFEIDRLYNFRFGTGYNFYAFYPIEAEKAYDILQIFKFSAGYYITSECLFNANYEYWDIKGKVRSVKNVHCWNRIVLEIKYLF